MKKTLLLLAAGLLLASCSGDDSEVGKKYLDTVDSNGTVTRFTYNDKKQVVEMASPINIVTITYDGDLIKTVTGTQEKMADYEFEYEDGLLTGYGIYDTNYPVEYDEDENMFTIPDRYMAYDLTDDDDVETIKSLGNNPVDYEIAYQPEKKGSLYNLGTPYAFLLFTVLPGRMSQHASRPAVQYLDMNIVNTYDDEGYVVRAEYYYPNGQLFVTDTYTYKKL